MPELVILALFVREQFVMAARLDQPAMVEYRDLIAEAAGGEAVGDINCRLCSDELIKPLIDFMLRHRVERGGRLVEDDDRRILLQRTGQQQPLPLPA